MWNVLELFSVVSAKYTQIPSEMSIKEERNEERKRELRAKNQFTLHIRARLRTVSLNVDLAILLHEFSVCVFFHLLVSAKQYHNIVLITS